MFISEIASDAGKATAVVKKFGRLKSMRTNWDEYWKELAEFVLPRKDNVYGFALTGENKHNRLYDSTSIHANEMLASALHSMLTNPQSVWFGLSTGDKVLDQKKPIRQWLQDSTLEIIKQLNKSNFQTQIHEVFQDLGGIGTASLRMQEEKDGDIAIRFHSRPIYESYVQENSKGQIDVLYREYEYDLRQIIQEFGEDILREEEFRLQNEKDDTRKYTIVHAVEPMHDRKDRFASFHVLCDKPFLLRENSFNEFPYAVPRWSKISGEIYGRSPSMKALPDIKMLNAMMKTAIRAAQKAADPPLMVPDNGFLLPLRTTPGGTNVYRAGTQDRIEPLVHNARVDINADIIEQTRLRIRQAFFIDQLQLQDGPQMTATEVMQRTEEKLRVMGPILGRLNDELLRPIIDRVFGIMMRKKLLPPAPSELKGKDLEIKYVSQISKAQRASEADTLTRVIQSIGPLIELMPQVMDNFDGDGAVRYHADVFGLAEEMLREPKVVAQGRQAQAQQQVDRETKEQDNIEADTAQKLGNAGP